MKIDRITLYHLDMPLAHPFETSFGLEVRRQCILVSASAEGLTGWGECVALDRPSYSSETIVTAWHILEDFLVPQALKTSWESMDDFLDMHAWVRGNPMARASMQSATWDLLAQSQGISLAELLSRNYSVPPRERVPVGVSIGIQSSIPATLDRIESFLADGFSRVKLKIKPGWDIDLVAKVRESYSDIPLMVDANSAYQMADLEIFQALDEFNLIMIEQPLAHDDIFHHRELQEMIATAICLDESIHSPVQAEKALEIGACRMINIKSGRVGGLWESREIHDLCMDRGVPVWCGGMLETGIGRAANLALASLPNFSLPTDTGPTARYWEEDIIEEEIVLNKEDSTITVPDKPGIGVTPRLESIDRFLLRKETYQ